MLDILKEKLNLDAHMYEIDKNKLKDVYNFPDKIKREYKIIEKKLIYALDNNKTEVDRKDIEKNYYSNYKYFRNYLISGFEIDDVQSEIKEMKELVSRSKKFRHTLEREFNLLNEEQKSQRKSYMNKFLQMCKLLRPKEENNGNEEKPVFRMYSEINNPSDIYLPNVSLPCCFLPDIPIYLVMLYS